MLFVIVWKLSFFFFLCIFKINHCCGGLNKTSPKGDVQVLIFKICECDLIWKRVFLDVVKDLEMKSSWVWIGLYISDGCLYNRKIEEDRRNRYKQGESEMWKQRLESHSAKPRHKKDCCQIPEARPGAWDGFFPQSLRRSSSLTLFLSF